MQESREKSKSKTDKACDEEDDTQMNLPVQYLFIQMEFCEKSTLRKTIDAGFYDDKRILWRHFREIIEGLNHIHLQVIF